MTVPTPKTCLVILTAVTLPLTLGDRAVAEEQIFEDAIAPQTAPSHFSQHHDKSGIHTPDIPIQNGDPSALAPTVSAMLPSASAKSAFSTQTADFVSAELVEDSFDDGFLDPGNISPDAPSEEGIEDEAGEIRRLPQPQQTQQPPQPNGQLLIRSSAFTSSNVTGSSITTVGDTVFVNGATLLLTPALGPDTRLIATAGGGLTRFGTAGENSYNSLDFSVGVQHRFTETTYGQIGWINNQLYSVNSGERTLSDNSARLLIGRQDQLDQQLRLDTAYELRARFTDPGDRSRISNAFSTRLRYDFLPDWQGSLGYRLAFSEYTQNGRADTTHQVQLATTYTPTKDTFVTGFASYAFGNSSEATTDLSNLSFGVGVGLNLPLF